MLETFRENLFCGLDTEQVISGETFLTMVAALKVFLIQVNIKRAYHFSAFWLRSKIFCKCLDLQKRKSKNFRFFLIT